MARRPRDVDPTRPFNPLDRRALAESVAKAMLERPFSPLPPEAAFAGAGIYAIYYSGKFKPYRPIATVTPPCPIYIGKAIPPGSRRGGFGLGEERTGVLYRRLCEHAETIQQAANLNIEHFQCQYLVTDDIWIPLAENMLIETFRPVWNVVIDGFGNHDPGRGRYQQQRSPWDVIHPGRPWAAKCVECARTPEHIMEALRAHLTATGTG